MIDRPSRERRRGRPGLALLVLVPTLAGAPPAAAEAVYATIYGWYSPNRGDSFATTHPAWAGSPGDRRDPDYRLDRIEGRMFSPEQAPPPGTVPVYSWYSPSRGDNFLTSAPGWQGAPSETRSPDYRFVRLEGYAFDPTGPQPPGTIPLYSWYDPDRGDNLATTDRRYAGVEGASGREPNYGYVRREGYVLPLHPRPDLARMIVPVFFQFQHAYTESMTGLPAFGPMDAVQTMLTVDEALARLNRALDAARGFDSRRITFARAGTKYVPTPMEDSEQTAVIYHWWSPHRKDNFATSLDDWRIRGVENEERSPDYRPVGKLGLLFRPDRPQPAGTIPIYGWYSPSRGDNHMTSDPFWSGESGDTKPPDYRFVRVEGYIYDPARPRPAGTIELHTWFSAGRRDYLSGAGHLWAGGPGETRSPDYRYVRKEGYVSPTAGCDLLERRVGAELLPRALNVLVTSDCGGVNISANILRADAGSLAHEIGHAMGQFHMFEGNKDLATVERLHRELDPEEALSCYRLGDRVCDTPPDYGFAAADGTEDPQCDNRHDVPIACRQLGPPCDPQEPIVDRVGLCTRRGNQGERRYEAVPLGLQLGTPNNIMAYHNHDEFTYEQFLRILDYGLWRAGKKDLVPSDEQLVFREFLGGPSPPIWPATPDAEQTLAYARRVESGAIPASGSGGRWRVSVTSSVGTGLLNFRVEIAGSGRASEDVRLLVGLPDGSSRTFTSSELLIEEDRIVFDEIYGHDISSLRGRPAAGAWTLELRSADTFSPRTARLMVLAE